MNLDRLTEPFPAEDIEWRVQQAGKRGEKIWAKVLAYVTNRAIQARLDEVFGPMGWVNQFETGPVGGVVCGLSAWCPELEAWVTKWDGAENTDVEAVKGGLSGSMKRAGAQWGIGRYLYKLDASFAKVHPGGKHYGKLPPKEGGGSYRWDPPPLPAWALPGQPAAKAAAVGPGSPVADKAAALLTLFEACCGATREDLERLVSDPDLPPIPVDKWTNVEIDQLKAFLRVIKGEPQERRPAALQLLMQGQPLPGGS